MTTTAHKKAKAIPQRADIDEKHTWNLADIFPDDATWEKEFGEAQENVQQAVSFSGKLAESPKVMYDCLKTRSELSRKVFNLYQYAFLNKDLDNRVSKYQAMTERAATLGSLAGAAFSFVEPELLSLDENKLLEMSAQFEKTDEFDFYIRELIRSKAHIRSAEVEELLANTSMISRGPDTIFTMLDNADLKYPSIRDEKGEEVQLTKQRFARFMESSDRRVRRDANDALVSVYRDHQNTIGASLASSVNADAFYMRARHFESSLHAALDGDNIPLSVFHSLLDTAEAKLEGLHSYVALRKKVLKLDEIAPYDMFCPLFPEKDYEIGYDEAVSTVLEAVTPLGETYCQTLRSAFDSRWIDVWETEGKGSGGYNFGNYDVHPFILMNYNNTMEAMFTLAHEMGHAMHSRLTSLAQPYPKSHYSIFVAEIASTLNEGLLLKLMLDRAADRAERLYLLNRDVDNTVRTFFQQIMYARFEQRIHEEVESGGALSPAAMNQAWANLTAQYFGPEMKLDQFAQYKWARIPHFYRAYYVYQYATSYAASQAILRKFVRGAAGIVEKYLELLSAGGKDHPIELLKICGLDMTTPEPFEETIRTFGEQVAQLETLTQEQPPEGS